MSATLTGLDSLPAGILVMPGTLLSGQALRVGEACVVGFNPAVSGLQRPVGSFLYVRDGTLAYQKTGTAATAWAVAGGGGGGAATLPSTLVLADATTTTAPDILVLRHTTSGAAGVGFGLTSAVELQNDVGTVRRVMTDVTSYTVPTNAAEEAKRVISLSTNGALSPSLTLQWGNAGTAAQLILGASAQANGLVTYAGLSRLDLFAGGGPIMILQNVGVQPQAVLNALAGTFAAPSVGVGGQGTLTGGIYSITGGVGITCGTNAALVNIMSITKLAAAFALNPSVPAASNPAGTEVIAADFDMRRTTTWLAGSFAVQREILFRTPTYAFAGASTIASAATVTITGGPIAGANATITNSYALWVQNGGVRFDFSFGFNVAPVTQQNTTGTAAGFTAGAGTTVNDQSTFTGNLGATAYRISDVVRALKQYGWLAL